MHLKLRQQRGAVQVFMAIAILPLMCLLALAVDGFIVMTSSLQQHNNAEYAALAALDTYLNTAGASETDRKNIALQKAESVASLNLYIGNPSQQQVYTNDLKNGTGGIVVFGFWDRELRTFRPGGPDINSVRVTLKTRSGPVSTAIKSLFARVMGFSEVNISSTATAFFDPNPGRTQFPYLLVKLQGDT